MKLFVDSDSNSDSRIGTVPSLCLMQFNSSILQFALDHLHITFSFVLCSKQLVSAEWKQWCSIFRLLVSEDACDEMGFFIHECMCEKNHIWSIRILILFTLTMHSHTSAVPVSAFQLAHCGFSCRLLHHPENTVNYSSCLCTEVSQSDDDTN